MLMNYVEPLSALQLEELFSMQDDLNKAVCRTNFGHSDWVSMNWPLHDALTDEAMELKGFLGWKWWKSSQNYNKLLAPSMIKQMQLEVIDLLHFGLSMVLMLESSYKDKTHMAEDCARCFARIAGKYETFDFTGVIPEDAIKSACADLIIASQQSRQFTYSHWYKLCVYLELSPALIMNTYRAKFTLNKFRQDNGYGDGTYQKEFACKKDGVLEPHEDNWWLERAMTEMAEQAEITVKDIYAWLKYYYTNRSKN